MKPRGTITPETYSRTRHNRFTREFTDEEIKHIDAAIDEYNEKSELDLLTPMLFGLLQRLQDGLEMDDIIASKMIIIASNSTIDEMHKDFDMNSFYAGAAWYSRELAKAIYEFIDEMKTGD